MIGTFQANSTRRYRRRGLTLTEVLVALFVMALGMISLLTLFPLGAMQVGQALRDDRAAQTARQADAYLRQTWRHNVIPFLPSPGIDKPLEPWLAASDDPNLEFEPWLAALDDPNLESRIHDPTPNDPLPTPNDPFLVIDVYVGTGTTPRPKPTGTGIPQTTPGVLSSSTSLIGERTVSPPSPLPGPPPNARRVYAVLPPDAYKNQKSFPVMIDPHGEFAAPGTTAPFSKFWVGADLGSTPVPAIANTTLFLPRRQLLAVNQASPGDRPQTVLELSGLTDDLSFEPNGAPGKAGLGRQGRYTWAAVVQRPRNDIRDVADLQILVFDRRVMPPLPGDEHVVQPNDAPLRGERQLTITVPAPDPTKGTVLVRNGGWIMDGTCEMPVTLNSRRNAHFYRIASFTEVPGAPANFVRYVLDLDTPLKDDVTATSRFYLFSGLIEVFQRPQLRPDVTY